MLTPSHPSGLKSTLGPKLVGRPLPTALRRTYWGHELHTDNDRLSRRVQVSGLEDPRISPLHGMIDRSTDAIFSTTPALRMYNKPEVISQIKDVLNLLFIFADVFEPRYCCVFSSLVPCLYTSVWAGGWAGGWMGGCLSICLCAMHALPRALEYDDCHFAFLFFLPLSLLSFCY